MQRLRELRVMRLLTIRALAAQAGVTPKTVMDIEAGRIRPQFATIRKIASVLEVEPTEVLEFAETIRRAAEGKVSA